MRTNPLYRLPFDTNRHPVVITQGYRGQHSHYKYHPQADYSFALDFGLPFGTEVLASRAGRVTTLFDSTTKFYRGLDRAQVSFLFANVVEIEHDDGTIDHYQHLQKGFGATLGITEGMSVLQGQPIALTGESGWVGPHPHLHFMVYRFVENAGKAPSVETFPVFSEEELMEMTRGK